MFKSLGMIFLTLISLTLMSCSVGLSGLQSYVDATDGYQFLILAVGLGRMFDSLLPVLMLFFEI